MAGDQLFLCNWAPPIRARVYPTGTEGRTNTCTPSDLGKNDLLPGAGYSGQHCLAKCQAILRGVRVLDLENCRMVGRP